MAKTKHYLELRQAMERAGYDQPALAKRIGRSPSYVSCRFRGLREWELEDAYRTMDLLGLPYEQIPHLFPRGGGASRGVRKAIEGRKAVRDMYLEVQA